MIKTETKKSRNKNKSTGLVLTGSIETRGDGVQEGVLRGEKPPHHRHPTAGGLRPPGAAAGLLLLTPETRQEARGSRCASQPLQERTDPRDARRLHLGTAGVVTIIQSTAAAAKEQGQQGSRECDAAGAAAASAWHHAHVVCTCHHGEGKEVKLEEVEQKEVKEKEEASAHRSGRNQDGRMGDRWEAASFGADGAWRQS